MTWEEAKLILIGVAIGALLLLVLEIMIFIVFTDDEDDGIYDRRRTKELTRDRKNG